MKNNQLTFVIDQIISDLGYYSPIELLLRQRRLRYADYESWRYGQQDFLAEKFMGSAKRINELLSSAQKHLQTLDFAQVTKEYYGWKGHKTNQLLILRQSDSEIDQSLLNTDYHRKETVPQLDLFFDNQGVQLANELTHAMAARDIPLAEQKLSQLEQIDPGHALCGQGATLLEALQQLEQQSWSEPVLWLDEIKNQLFPLAKEALQGKVRDFIAPFWRQLAVNLKEIPYSEEQPDLHPAYCYTQILLWPQVINCIQNTSNWQQYPTLYHLLSQAFYQNNQRSESIQIICNFCWQFPQRKPEFILDANSFQQYSLFIDQELDEQWGWYHFPAWLILHEPGLIPHIDPGRQPVDAAFILLTQLLQLQQLANDQVINLRGELKNTHSGIFEYYLTKYSQY